MKREMILGSKLFPASSPDVTNFTASANLASIPRSNQRSAIMMLAIGSVTGAPTSFSVNAKMQTSDDNINWVDFIPGAAYQSAVATPALSAAATNSFVVVDLDGAGPYIRAVIQPTFVGGTTPSVNAFVAIALGDPRYSNM